MAKQPRIGSSRLQEGGQLATHKRDFLAHAEGGGFRHTADHIDMNPQLAQFPADNVQSTLELIASLSASEGSGFISIGKTTSDGYATGSYNVTDVIDLETAFANAFADSRLQNGGIILVLAGVYRINNTVQVPPGITIMGDGPGTIIIGEMAEIPMFKFQKGVRIPGIGGDTGVGDKLLDQGAPLDQSGLRNIIITDNSDGYVQVSSQPVASMSASPMVLLEVGSKAVFDNVKFIGRLNNGAVLNRAKTLRAIGTETTGTGGTHLEVNRCYFDGLATGIRFEPGNNDADTLIIRNCKARVFGDEGTGAPDDEVNTFAAFTLCKLTADNNYIIGGISSNARVSNAFYVLSGNPDDTFLNISNTSGRSSQSGSTVRLVLTASSVNYRGAITNNIWGADTADGWSVFIGGPGADFAGEGAIDLFLSLASPEFGPANLYIFGASTYNVSVPGSNRYNFIGITNGVITQPVINLNISPVTATDELGRARFDCGNVIKNVRFVSDSGGQFHVVRPGGNSNVGGITIEKSIFVDAGISVNDSVSSFFPSSVRIEDCEFQRSNFSNNLALLLPNVHDVITIDGCIFGGGYAGFIGRDASASYGTAIDASKTNVNVKNCRFEPNPLTAANGLDLLAYFAVSEVYKCVVDNCTFLEDTESLSLVNATVLTAGLRAFYHFEAEELTVRSSTINGTIGSYTDPDLSATVSLIGTRLVPRGGNLVVDGNIINSSILQVGGSTNSLLDRGGCYICNNSFRRDENDTQLMLDVDLNNASSGASDHWNLHIYNNTLNSFGESAAGVEHPDTGTLNYRTIGGVQINTRNVNLDFSNNNVYVLIEGGVIPSSFTGFAGVSIDTETGSTGLTTTNVTNNNIVVQNAVDPAVAGDRLSALSVEAVNGNITNNTLRFNNQISPLSNGTANVLYYTVINPVASGNYLADRISHVIQGNFFSRRDDDGGTTNLVNGFIYLEENDTDGSSDIRPVITKNRFSDTTTDGTDESVVNGDYLGFDRGISYDNYNEIYTKRLHYDGIVGVADDHSSNQPVVGGAGDGGVNSYVTSYLNPATTAYEFFYTDTGSPREFIWRINLNNILPLDATVTRVQASVVCTAVPTVTSDATLTLFIGSNLTDSNSSLGTVSDSLEIIPVGANLRPLSNAANNYIEVSYECESAATVEFRVSRITLEYKL